ncbi:hypothetical protein [Paraburkholderia sp. C35]|uniref:hypothetical protein n=1 Tax=Paraburkholderia sp. C35 TaxID=2126993 RepID=UPI0013A52EDB|nr:hypothetical protein [Paraburkholderia sp. C35]
MSDKSSGRNEYNAGSDSAKHHTGTAHEQYSRIPDTNRSERVTNTHPNGAVGNDKPPKSDERSAVKS